MWHLEKVLPHTQLLLYVKYVNIIIILQYNFFRIHVETKSD